ncbi:MAG: HEAT repeat domain-containing protein [Paludibaculum sp.]
MMHTLLGRALTPDEQASFDIVHTGLANPRKASRHLWRELGLSNPAILFAIAMSLIPVQPSSVEERALCEYLIGVPEFLPFLADPESFDRGSLVAIGRAMLRVDARFDAKLANALFTQQDPPTPALLHVLGALDVISPGGRLTLTLARLLRECSPSVASKVALLMARRVSNPNWVERQLSSPDARLRANVVESLWGVDTPQVRARLARAIEDANNRVVGNAIYGLHLLKDHRVPHHLEGMLQHENPSFRATAAWVIGKTGEIRYRECLMRAMGDHIRAVREAARRAFANLLPGETLPATTVPPPDGTTATPPAEPPDIPTQTPDAGDMFSLSLDGSFKQLSRRS